MLAGSEEKAMSGEVELLPMLHTEHGPRQGEKELGEKFDRRYLRM